MVRLGRQVSYGESADAFVFLSNRSSEVGTWVAEIVDKQSHAVTWSHPINGTPIQMLQGTVKDVVLTAEAVRFVTVRHFSATEIDVNALGGVFDMNVLSRAEGRQEVTPLARDGHFSLIETTEGLPDLERGDATEVREAFRTLYKGAPAIGVVRGRGREHAKWSLAYIDPAKKVELWEKPLPDSVQPESVFVGPDGWDYYIDTQSGAVTGISGEAGRRELWRLPTEYLYDAHILQIDAE